MVGRWIKLQETQLLRFLYEINLLGTYLLLAKSQDSSYLTPVWLLLVNNNIHERNFVTKLFQLLFVPFVRFHGITEITEFEAFPT